MPRNFTKNFYGPEGTQRALAPPGGATREAQLTRARQEAQARPGGLCLKEICPRGNNKVVIYISLYHDKCLLFMLELY